MPLATLIIPFLLGKSLLAGIKYLRPLVLGPLRKFLKSINSPRRVDLNLLVSAKRRNKRFTYKGLRICFSLLNTKALMRFKFL